MPSLLTCEQLYPYFAACSFTCLAASVTTSSLASTHVAHEGRDVPGERLDPGGRSPSNRRVEVLLAGGTRERTVAAAVKRGVCMRCSITQATTQTARAACGWMDACYVSYVIAACRIPLCCSCVAGVRIWWFSTNCCISLRSAKTCGRICGSLPSTH